MNIIKRDGTQVPYNREKIIQAISKAGYVKLKDKKHIADDIENFIKVCKNDITVEEIQDLVEKDLMDLGYHNVAKEYIRYRYKREIIRKSKGANAEIIDIVKLANQDVNEENSNKNPVINSTQRDYIAGAVSKELSEKLLFPKDVIDAHKEGIIHIHKVIVA